jgi:hypothetical protein
VSAAAALWLYRSGRLQGVVDAVKGLPTGVVDPANPFGGGLGTRPVSSSGGSGGVPVANLAACYAMVEAGDPACLGDVWRGLNSPEDILHTIGGALDTVFGGIGSVFGFSV